MSNGETTWSLLDLNDPLLRGIGHSHSESAHHRNASGTSSLSSYGQESLINRGSGFENGVPEMGSGPSNIARPKTNVSNHFRVVLGPTLTVHLDLLLA